MRARLLRQEENGRHELIFIRKVWAGGHAVSLRLCPTGSRSDTLKKSEMH